MHHTSEKEISGKRYLYAVRSIRLPDGRVAKMAMRIKSEKGDGRKIEEILDLKEVQAMKKYAEKNYPPLQARDPNALEKIETARMEYKKILKKLSKNQLEDLFNRFTVNFTYESNAIEGNSLTLKDVAILLNENVAAKGKDLREFYETKNSREVVDLILGGKLGVNEPDIISMHSLLVKNMGIPEGYKAVPNYIHGRFTVTAPPEKVKEEMAGLLKWFEENKKKCHPLQLAAMFHGRFECIHPFEDGNGRVGRFLINVILTNAGYPPLIIRKTNRLAYLNALEDYDNGMSRQLENFLFERFKETHEKFFKIYVKYV